jgi:site-specific recombinase XerD
MLFDNSLDLYFFEQWLLKKRVPLAESSIYVYVRALSCFLQQNYDISDINSYNDYISKTAYKKRCSYYYFVLKNYIQFKFAGNRSKREELLDNLLKPKVFKNIKRQRVHLEVEKLVEVIESMSFKKHRVMAVVQEVTGIRVHDLLTIKTHNVAVETYKGKKVIKLTVLGKGDKTHIAFIHDPAVHEILETYLKNGTCYDDYVFVELGDQRNNRGNINSEFMMLRMNYFWYWQDLKKACAKANVDPKLFSTHDFRRCFARRFWERYLDLFKLQNILSHEDPATTIRYLKQSGMSSIDEYSNMQQLDNE